MTMDWAEQQARNALQQFRRGSQINGGCVEVYPAVADAIRDAYKRGVADGVKLGREAEMEAALMDIRSKARFEQKSPTGMHMTCLSLIEKAANKALKK